MKLVSAALILLPCAAQTLVPRAYTITPVKANAITLTYVFNNGAVQFNSVVPVVVNKGTFNAGIASYYHGFALFGRSANFVASLPYAAGSMEGVAFGQTAQIYRSGLLDSSYRFSVNLKGGPAMTAQEMQKWRQKTLLGVSVLVVAPTGQYDPARLINQGTNRWSFKPEFGLSQRWNKWVLDGYAGVWFLTPNSKYYPGTLRQTQTPIGAFEMHLSYDFKPFLWASVDGNYWVGGTAHLNGVENPLTLQNNSRIGATVSFPIRRRQSIKASISRGAFVLFGGDYDTLSIAYQYSWLGTKFR